ncbi:MAG: formylmethanofuran--tetrahydromethanopterin N-formyltransferase [Pirellulaceae bacterium]
MKIGETLIDNTFAEAFGMRYTRLIVTAEDEFWLDAAVRELTGYSASVISCDAEVGRERRLAADTTPDGRVGAAVLLFGFATEPLAKSVANRTGQCVMTCPSTAAYDGLADGRERIPLGKHLRFFGDGYQKSKLLDGRRFWRIPVMDGEFVVEESVGVEKGVGGGNIILQATTKSRGLAAARRVAEALAEMPGVITPFPGGVVRSGSKVGSRYQALAASTSHAFCPTLRGRVTTQLADGVQCAYEIVMDGIDEATVGQAIAVAIRAAAGDGVVAISAGNYGGKLGKYHFRLQDLL